VGEIEKWFSESEDLEGKNLFTLFDLGFLKLGELRGDQLVKLRDELERRILEATRHGDEKTCNRLEELIAQVYEELRELEW